VTEVAVYTFLGAAIASAVFIVGERPYWHVALVAVAALVIVLLSALVSRRHPPRISANSRHGRRRRS
jgi:membrane protein implicated in regulation of membrane protease activity